MQRSFIDTWWYDTYKRYVKLIHESLLVRHRYTLGTENLPAEGERYIIISNHQNTANDPLNYVFALPRHYHVYALARANVFAVHPLITRFLTWIGLIPAYRLGWEGTAGLQHNFKTFDLVAQHVNEGDPVIIFPEAGHTQGHYLGRFTTGAVRMAFHAAQANGYSADVKILPTAHHYSDYFDIQTDFEWQIAKPISLAPYYAAFQEHPNSVMREITRQLHSTVQALMLDEGIEDYAEKDFLRRSALRPSNLQTMPLPERLEEDKRFSAMLNAHEHYADIIRLTAELRQRETAIGVDDTTVALHPGIAKTMAWLLVLIVLLPLWLVSLWPHLICYAFPPKLMKTDKMFTNSYRYILSAVVLYPLFALLTVLVMGIAWGLWWQAVVWVLLWIPTGRFAWWYYTLLRRTRCALRRLANPSAVKAIEQLRDHLKKKIYE